MTSFRLPLLTFALVAAGTSTTSAQDQERRGKYREFTVWATSCAHVSSDAARGRFSVERAIAQSEGRDPKAPSFDWDLWVDAGDLAGGNQPPTKREGRELVRQLQTMTRNRREQIYHVQGNHDAMYFDQPRGEWFREWADPFGGNTERSGVDPKRRPFPVKGTWERYRFLAGNVLFLMLSDRNDAPFPVGRGSTEQRLFGGNPAGAVTRETFEWWKREVLENQDKIIITVHHHALRDTTTASGTHEGNAYHHNDTSGGASYLYYIIENEQPGKFEFTPDAHVFEDFLAEFEQEHGHGAIDMWIAGHTHVRGPRDDTGDKSITESRWGVHFLQVAALTLHHGGGAPMSRLITFERESDLATARVYLHEPHRDHRAGFFEPSAVELKLRHAFDPPRRIRPMAAFPPETKRVRRKNIALNRQLLPFVDAQETIDLVDRFDPSGNGDIPITNWIRADEKAEIGNRPWVEQHETRGEVAQFDGTHRMRIGAIDTEGWKGLTIEAHIQVLDNVHSIQRAVCMDRIGGDGCFSLSYHQHRWRFWVWDQKQHRWAKANEPLPKLVQPEWHHVVGVVDPERSIVELILDGKVVASSPWHDEVIHNRGSADLVIGADSSELMFGESMRGFMHGLKVRSRPLSTDERRALLQGQ